MSADPRFMHPFIRRLWMEDLDRVLEIEQASYPFPWSRGIFADCLRVGYACFGVQLGNELVGYSVQNWGAGESHLLNLCIHPAYQGNGFGSLLLEHSIGQARSAGCQTMYLEVRPSNRDAVRLYQRRGFEVVGERLSYYQAGSD
nr:ribosomal protein S18-alanine N-acetyltransferase [Xanthomonadales bacterium]NIN58252.1 ribosomal protein S18-alanine N-acetyltransferase [Xanthomonadales bacterium]NIN73604.1 ribosomal protein S18-alanine N-acetyltransferase [Xanthomonadales bacterium]NIO12286.1 ribosomal protein S18-alanine N-acetyltransferase [Xanthomonadales bacterium]NIP10645.1 ribosomal protein S18-alanine N-acetyltransferase [Xanthomonadales bacterium]